jgi:hypothetical protein
MKLNIGLVLSGIYIVVSLALVLTQGLMGESFIALILGMPWTLALAAIEFGGVSGVAAQVLLIIPMVLNAVLLYVIGTWINRVISRR